MSSLLSHFAVTMPKEDECKHSGNEPLSGSDYGLWPQGLSMPLESEGSELFGASTLSIGLGGSSSNSGNTKVTGVRCFFHPTKELAQLRDWFASNKKPSDWALNRYAEQLNSGPVRQQERSVQLTICLIPFFIVKANLRSIITGQR